VGINRRRKKLEKRRKGRTEKEDLRTPWRVFRGPKGGESGEKKKKKYLKKSYERGGGLTLQGKGKGFQN